MTVLSIIIDYSINRSTTSYHGYMGLGTVLPLVVEISPQFDNRLIGHLYRPIIDYNRLSRDAAKCAISSGGREFYQLTMHPGPNILIEKPMLSELSIS